MTGILAGGVAVVTGAGSGIGRALALRLAREEMSVALVDLDSQGLERTAQQMPSTTEFSLHVTDVADSAGMQLLAREVAARFGRVTLLINNAGVALHGTVREVSPEQIAWLMNINLWGMIYGVKYFLPILLQQPHSYIVNMSSVFGLLTVPGEAAYSASKFAIRGFTESLQQELSNTSIKVCCVYPGRTATEIGLRANQRAGIANESSSTSRMSSAQTVAHRIVDGIVHGRSRILIGTDAIWLDRLQRIFPNSYARMLNFLRKSDG